MKRTLRVLAVVALALGGSFAVSGAAQATETDGCSDPSTSYTPDGVCKLDVTVRAFCENDIPYLGYTATYEGTANKLTLRWVNPNGGADVVMSDLPLNGSVMWPGTTVDANGDPTDYPGWRLVNGTWVQGDEWDWTLSNVGLELLVNPVASAVVSYPPASTGCVPTGGASSAGLSQAVLSETGTTTAPMLAVAAGLLVGGVALVAARARRGAVRS